MVRFSFFIFGKHTIRSIPKSAIFTNLKTVTIELDLNFATRTGWWWRCRWWSKRLKIQLNLGSHPRCQSWQHLTICTFDFVQGKAGKDWHRKRQAMNQRSCFLTWK